MTERETSSYRVLIIVNEIFDAAGGNLRAAVNVAEAMVEHGDEVTFSAPWVAAHPHATVDSLDDRIDRKFFRASRTLARFGGSTRQLLWLARNVQRFDQVQVHSLFHLSALYAILLCALKGVPVVLWPHGTLDPFDLRKHARAKRWAGPLITRHLLNRCAALIFTSERESRIAVTFGADPHRRVVPLPVRPMPFHPEAPVEFRAKFEIPENAPLILFLGRLNYKKGLPLLVEAVAQIDGDVYLVVAGGGDDSELRSLRDTARACGIAGRLRITGWLEGNMRAAAYAAADVFALLSESENFGLALAEALSARLPAVISNQVFIADDLARAGAALVVPRSASAAAAALTHLLAHPAAAAALGERGHSYVRSEFAPTAVADRLHNLIG